LLRTIVKWYFGKQWIIRFLGIVWLEWLVRFVGDSWLLRFERQ
jgi:hypothetical protein